jgi:glycine/D-amino acid oxidase-like deaminating enzyme/nitrite reductase/ring-hydroxylating ferredoxin subunit
MARLSIWELSAQSEAFPTLKGDLDIDVCVVGAGITGVTAAYLLKRAGKRVALVDRKTVGSGDTGRTTAHLTAILDRSYAELIRTFDRATAKLAWEGSMEAIGLIEELAAREGIACDFKRVDAVQFAPKGATTRDVHHDEQALRSLGVTTHPVGDIPLHNADGYRVTDQGRVHPLKLVNGLARRVHGGGSLVLEHTAVVGFDGEAAETPGGRIRAGKFIFATHTPIEELVGSHLRLTPMQTYVVAVPRVDSFEDDLFFDNLDPYHYVRNHARWLIVGGADHPTGARQDTEGSFADLEHYVRRNIKAEPRILARWSGEIFDPADGLPYIGAGGKGEFFATGFSGTGITFGTLAGGILRDLALGEPNRYAEAFSPHRVSGWPELVTHNLNAAWHFTQDRMRVADPEVIDNLAPGEGVVVRLAGRPVAVCKHGDGSLSAVSAVCTHLRCLVNWNRAEQTWDCPCHGSRFSSAGEVHAGPAARALEPVDLDAVRRAPEPAERERRAP